MTENSDAFSSKFTYTLKVLDGPDARFWGEGILNDLLALEPHATTDSRAGGQSSWRGVYTGSLDDI